MLRTRDFVAVAIVSAALAFIAVPSNAPAGVVQEASTQHMSPRDASGGPRVDEKQAQETPVTPPAPARPRMRVGCEGAVSALAGREARQLLPSRCLV